MAQDYNDLIITIAGDSIKCKIGLINDVNIFYTYKPKKSEKSGYIALKNVKEYYKGDKSFLPVTNSSISTNQAMEKQITIAGNIITENVLNNSTNYMKIGAGLSIVGVAGTLLLVNYTTLAYMNGSSASLEKQNNTITTEILIGSTISIAGIALFIIGINDFKKEILKLHNKNSISLYIQPTCNGVGLICKF